MSLRRASIGISALALVALTVAQVAVSATKAPSTTVPVRIVAINVSITDAKLTLDHQGVGFQNAVQFRVRNRTAVLRTFAIGGQKIRVAAKAQKILLIYFETRGVFPYVSTAAKKPALRGVFKVV